MAFKRDKSDINKSTTKCAVAKRCGGCDYIEIDYKKQLVQNLEKWKKLFQWKSLIIIAIR